MTTPEYHRRRREILGFCAWWWFMLTIHCAVTGFEAGGSRVPWWYTPMLLTPQAVLFWAERRELRLLKEGK